MSCNVGESQCGGVAMWGSLTVAVCVRRDVCVSVAVWECCRVGELWCGGVAVWRNCSVGELQYGGLQVLRS